MSFPKLVINSSPSGTHIVDIYMYLPNQVETNMYLIRDKYEVTRHFYKQNTGYDNNVKFPEIRYDKVVYLYQWIGHIDIKTDDLARIDGLAYNTYVVLQNALFFGGGTRDEQYITHSVPVPSDSNNDSPSRILSNSIGKDYGIARSYKYSSSSKELKDTKTWYIKKTTIEDNQNGTSRVTFILESNSKVFDLESVIDDTVLGDI